MDREQDQQPPAQSGVGRLGRNWGGELREKPTAVSFEPRRRVRTHSRTHTHTHTHLHTPVPGRALRRARRPRAAAPSALAPPRPRLPEPGATPLISHPPKAIGRRGGAAPGERAARTTLPAARRRHHATAGRTRPGGDARPGDTRRTPPGGRATRGRHRRDCGT